MIYNAYGLLGQDLLAVQFLACLSGKLTRLAIFGRCGRPLRHAIVAALIALPLFANSLSAAELHITQNQLPVTLGPYLDYIEDPQQQLSIDDVIALDSGWQRSRQSIPTLGISSSAHWFSIVITGEEMQDRDLLLSIDSPALDRIEFYFVQNNRVIKESLAGDTIPYSELEYPYRIPTIPFEVSEAGEEIRIYFRASSNSGVEIPLVLTTMELLAQQQQGALSFLGAFFAFFFVCFCSCSLLYYFIRDKQFLSYTLFFGCSITFFLAQTGIGRVWFWENSGEANNRVAYISAAVLIAAFCLLGQTLNFTNRYRDSVVLVLRFLAYCMLPVGLYFLFIPIEQISAENVLTVMYIGLLTASTVYVLAGITAYQGSRAALYLFVSLTLMLLAYVSLLTYRFELVERWENSQLFGEGLMMIAALMLLASLGEFIRSKNEEFNQVRLETKAKGDFLRNVSREFLTPVHLILANSKRLMAVQSNKLDEPTRQHMSTVIKQSDHLHNLINDLLEMAELESESFEPEFELVEMSHFLTEVKEMLAPSAMEKGLELTSHFASGNLLVQTDKSRLQHTLINVITNAIKYTDSGNIVLGYKAVYFRRRLGIEIFVRDSGRGMSEEFQQRLFQEFAREDEVSEKEPEGTGLGMVIVKRMVEKLGGEITFESQKDTGSEFFIRLPLRVPSS